jgi:hypothetical protein
VTPHSCYKYALLLSLIDISLDHSAATGLPPDSITTRQLAARVLELYWPHSRPYTDPARTVLRQSNVGNAEIITLISTFRTRHAPDPTAPLSRARHPAPARLDKIIADSSESSSRCHSPASAEPRARRATWATMTPCPRAASISLRCSSA